MNLGKWLELLGLLAAEVILKPHWAFYHMWGFIDERVLLKFHRRRQSDDGLHFRSLEEILQHIGGMDWKRVSTTLMAADGLSGENETKMTKGAIAATNDASVELQRLVFCVTTLVEPETIVEVGVGRGATTRALLLALERNKKGHLYSIEFPALRKGYSKDVGILVPAKLCGRWTLIVGPSQSELPSLLHKLGNISIFVHDGAHSFHIQQQDYSCAITHLRPGGILISDDINNDSFFHVAEENGLDPFLIGQSKKDPIGIALTPA